MSESFYDAVVLGTDLSPLCCGALLAKRGFRVLVLGQDDVRPRYDVGRFSLQRHPYVGPSARSPLMRRILAELGLSQTFRQVSSTPELPFQVAMPGHRFDLALDPAALSAELEREFPKVKRPVEDFHRLAGKVATQLDSLLERDRVWPPEKFFERQEFARACAAAGLGREGAIPDPLAEFPDEHPFRTLVRAVGRLTDDIDAAQTAPLRMLHLYNNLYRRSARIDGGIGPLRELLIDRIRSHSGEVRIDERASRILVRRGRTTGVRLYGSGDEVGAAFVAAGIDLAAVLRLLDDRSAFDDIFERVGEPQLQRYRYTLNVVLKRDGLPAGMARDVLWIPPDETAVERGAPLYVQADPLDDEHMQLCVETQLPAAMVERSEDYLGGVRSRMRSALRALLPFIDDHAVLFDSPHDGLPPQWVGDTDDDDAGAGDARRGPQTMPAIYGYPVTRALDLCALSVRTPVRHLVLSNAQVAPGLGAEGRLLSACSAARLITKSDSSREWMRRGLWTKVEV